MYDIIILGDKMYSYIIGEVTGYDKNCIIVENNKIGYLINVSNPYSFKLNEECKVYLYNHIKEDENSLYGFKTKAVTPSNNPRGITKMNAINILKNKGLMYGYILFNKYL